MPTSAIYLLLGLHNGRPSYRRSLQPSKENIQHFKTWNFLIFSTFVGHFCPPGSGSGFRIRIRNHWSDWIRIRIRNTGEGGGVRFTRWTPQRIEDQPLNGKNKYKFPLTIASSVGKKAPCHWVYKLWIRTFFRPRGSVSVSQRYGSRSFYHQAKIVRKMLTHLGPEGGFLARMWGWVPWRFSFSTLWYGCTPRTLTSTNQLELRGSHETCYQQLKKWNNRTGRASKAKAEKEKSGRDTRSQVTGPR